MMRISEAHDVSSSFSSAFVSTDEGEMAPACATEAIFRSFRYVTESTPNQLDEPVRERSTPTEIVVVTDELLVVNFVPLRK